MVLSQNYHFWGFVHKTPNKSVGELTDIVKALPQNLTSLDLNALDLGFKQTSGIVAVMGALPQNLKSLNLRENNLSTQSSKALVAIMRALPQNLSSLKLSRNGLKYLKDAELIGVFNALKDTCVTTIEHGIELEARPNVKHVYDAVIEHNRRTCHNQT